MESDRYPGWHCHFIELAVSVASAQIYVISMHEAVSSSKLTRARSTVLVSQKVCKRKWGAGRGGGSKSLIHIGYSCT